MPHEVEHQAANGAPSCIVEDEQGPSWILYHNQLLLIAPEEDRGIRPCVNMHAS